MIILSGVAKKQALRYSISLNRDVSVTVRSDSDSSYGIWYKFDIRSSLPLMKKSEKVLTMTGMRPTLRQNESVLFCCNNIGFAGRVMPVVFPRL
jgi:hypothetical protein